MRKHRVRTREMLGVALLCTVMVLTGCGSSNGAEASKNNVTWRELQRFDAQADASPEAKRETARFVAAATYPQVFAEWIKTGGKIEPPQPPELPVGSDAVFIAIGAHPASYSITSVSRTGVELLVEADVETPGRNCVTVQNVEFPFVVLAVEAQGATSADIKIDKRTKDC